MDCSWPLEGSSAEKLNKVVDMLSFMLTLLHSVEDGRFSSIEVATNAETHRKAAEAFGIDRFSVCKLIVDVAPEAKKLSDFFDKVVRANHPDDSEGETEPAGKHKEGSTDLRT